MKSVGHIFTGKPELARDQTGYSQVRLLTVKQAGLTSSKPGSSGRRVRAMFDKNSGKF